MCLVGCLQASSASLDVSGPNPTYHNLSQILTGILWGEMTSGRAIVSGPLSSSYALSLKLCEIVISSVKFGTNRNPGTNQGLSDNQGTLGQTNPRELLLCPGAWAGIWFHRGQYPFSPCHKFAARSLGSSHWVYAWRLWRATMEISQIPPLNTKSLAHHCWYLAIYGHRSTRKRHARLWTEAAPLGRPSWASRSGTDSPV